ncbi:type II toxin-antitoxin system RelE/ParE family toxin [Pandoraea sputorum]
MQSTCTSFQTDGFRSWLSTLRNLRAKARIASRIRRAELGNFGDTKSVGNGLWEMRIDVGPGYRVYYGRQGRVTYVLLCGGDKSSQQADIAQASALWHDIKLEPSNEEHWYHAV